MATVGDYVVVSDGTTTLEIGRDIDQTFTFSVPSNVNLGQSAVATWRLEAEGPPRNLAWNLSINGTELVGFTHGSDRFTGLQEVFQGSVLQAGSNDATVAVTAGTGRIKFSDLVIHFQVDV
ncbi:MAG TPA: hypothetical protein VLL08_07945 [Kineosporiaceae bacterium]|nr:hypothetical protein [Kineosporiaceae bacterium]